MCPSTNRVNKITNLKKLATWERGQKVMKTPAKERRDD